MAIADDSELLQIFLDSKTYRYFFPEKPPRQTVNHPRVLPAAMLSHQLKRITGRSLEHTRLGSDVQHRNPFPNGP
jgi:hypothetical protein